ncbi:MAG: anthranilate phosphoribosyltransferase [Deltaproteobacteria bacterium]|nr:anthranilate phosphoribosyltransferase [Deltaproteobacteria bacterium]
MTNVIQRLIEGRNLTEEETFEAVTEMLDGTMGQAAAGAFLYALRTKGETDDELIGALKAFRRILPEAKPVPRLLSMDRQEIQLESETRSRVMEHESRTRTFNVSTATAFVVAGSGMRVLKSGMAPASDYCGSENVLKALRISLNVSMSQVIRFVEDVGLGFLYAANGKMRPLYRLLDQLGFRTVFNIVGPLANPGGAETLFLGVYEAERTEKTASLLLKLGVQRAGIVYSEDSLDEMSICGETRITELENGRLHTYTVVPEDFGLKRALPTNVQGGDAGENARIIRSILDGVPGAPADLVLLSSGFALYLGGRVGAIEEGIELAREAIRTGSAANVLEALMKKTGEEGFVRKAI